MASLTYDSSYGTSTAEDPWVITNAVLPAGDLLFCLGWYRSSGSAQRTIASMTHTALSSAALVTTQDSQNAIAFYSEDVVVGLELWRGTSTGGTADLTIDFNGGTVWSPTLAIFVAQDIRDALTLGTANMASGTSLNVSASHSRAQVGIAFAYARAGSAFDMATSPWTRDVLVSGGSQNKMAVAHSDSTQGGTVTFNSDVALTTGLGMVILFGPSAKGGMMLAS